MTNSLVHLCSLNFIFHGTNPAIYIQNFIRRKDTIMALRTTSGAALHNLKLFRLPSSSVLHFAWHDDKTQQKAALSILRKTNPHPRLPTLRSVMRRFHSLPLPLSFKDSSMREIFEKKKKTYILSLCFKVISSEISCPLLFRWRGPPSFTELFTLLYLLSLPILLLCVDLLSHWWSSLFR